MEKDILKLYTIQPIGCRVVVYFAKDITKVNEAIEGDKKIHEWYMSRNNNTKVETSQSDDGYILLSESKEYEDSPLLLAVRYSDDKDYFMEKLVHEITHLVFHLEDYHSIVDETEFRAHLSEMLYKDLRDIYRKNRTEVISKVYYKDDFLKEE